MSLPLLNHGMQHYPYRVQKVEVPGQVTLEADWERDNSHWLNSLTDQHVNLQVPRDYVKASITPELMPIITEDWRNTLFIWTKSHYPDFNLHMFDLPHERQIIHHETTCGQRFSEEVDSTRKVSHRIERGILNSKPLAESSKRLRRLSTTLLP
ncbi:hypothetical protein FOWG_15459 [Fusarium oxysporum f. sp. lycopersici MN25]|nr:hypothetical protein FOWG_15459 [Fusarium oxysporum f. sp. lycopersici MN25]